MNKFLPKFLETSTESVDEDILDIILSISTESLIYHGRVILTSDEHKLLKQRHYVLTHGHNILSYLQPTPQKKIMDEDTAEFLTHKLAEMYAKKFGLSVNLEYECVYNKTSRRILPNIWEAVE